MHLRTGSTFANSALQLLLISATHFLVNAPPNLAVRFPGPVLRRWEENCQRATMPQNNLTSPNRGSIVPPAMIARRAGWSPVPKRRCSAPSDEVSAGTGGCFWWRCRLCRHFFIWARHCWRALTHIAPRAQAFQPYQQSRYRDHPGHPPISNRVILDGTRSGVIDHGVIEP
jgi:hypothetical protein